MSKDKALCLASEKGCPGAVRCLLDNGAKANCQNDRVESPLYLAAANGCTEVVKILLNSGSSGEDALALAVRKGSLAAVNKLLECHVYPNDGLEELLLLAASNKRSDIVKTFCNAGGGFVKCARLCISTSV